MLVIQHPVANFDGWKKAFDSDPIGRARNGVTGYTVLRGADDPNFVVVHLEFASLERARQFLPALEKLWQKVGDRIGFGDAKGVEARILDQVERVEY